VEEGEASCSDNQVSHNLWKKIWNFKGSRVVKFFLWKACSDILPTKEKLHRRKVVLNPLCPICLAVLETLSHALWTCPSAQDVWAECNGKLQKSVCRDGDFTETLFQVGNRLEDDERHLMVTVARLIWFRRNKFIFEGVFQDPKTMVRIAREQVTAVDNAIRRNTEPTLRNNTRDVVTWQKPPQGKVKINWDAAVDSKRGMIEMGDECQILHIWGP
jgi:hypothetical protein